MSATLSPARTGRYDAVVILLHCRACKTVTTAPIWEAAKKLNLCCGQPLAFLGHVKPCACPSCQ